MRHKWGKTLPVCLLGVAAGFLNGALGAGGGILIVLGLQRLQKDDARDAYVSALCVMLPISLFSLYRYAAKGHVDPALLSPLVLPALLGGTLGAWLLHRVSARALARVFACLLIVSGVVLIL